MASKQLFDNLYKVIKGNSGAITQNEVVATEIFDLQIPRGFCARIRKIRTEYRLGADQDITNLFGTLRNAVVLDADDETHTYIPTFEIDHDVVSDSIFQLIGIDQVDTTDLILDMSQSVQWIDFDETLDVVTVRNIRCNSIVFGLTVGGANPPQVDNTIYFTYEKISADLYSKLLGIS